MKKVLDKFSKQAKDYKKYRPVYPASLYQELLRITENQEACWDCGTGNGQVAVALSNHFKNVYATDISEKQLKEAEKKDNIIYSVERAEKTGFKDNTFDLVTVAQAIHWFDFDAFYQEVHRVAKKDAILAIWGYGLLNINGTIDQLIRDFYKNKVGPYWNKERRHIEQYYETIGFNLPEIALPSTHKITTQLSLSALRGYFNSWSCVHNYISAKKENPVDQLIKEIEPHWEDGALKTVTYPIFTKIGRITK